MVRRQFRQRRSAFAGLAAAVALAVASAGLVQPVGNAAAPGATANPPLQTCTAEMTRASQRFWAFGNGAGIDFGTSGTTATAVTIPGNTVEGSTVVTDTNGQMLFWSNGQTLFNRNNAVMPNGSGLQLNASATQTVAAFPSIDNPGTYFVVTTTGASEVGGKGRLYYSEVDMSLDGGLGAVTAVKNVPLGGPQDATEALSAVPNATGDGFWVLTHRAGTPNILAYEFDGDGPVSGVAVESVMSTPNGNQFATFNISEDLSQIVQQTSTTGGPDYLRLLEIDAASGVLHEEFTWELPTGSAAGTAGYSADFSPSGDYVYATKIFGTPRLYRYRIAGAANGADVKATEENIAGIGNGGQVRKAPDGRMYVVNRTAAALHVINTPDDLNPGFVANGFALAAGTVNGWGLPQVVTGCARPPLDVQINGPADGAEFENGTEVPADFGCSGADLVSCTAVDENGNPIAPGQPLDTTTPGTHTITVTATDADGNTVTKTVTYTVAEPPNQPPTAQVNGPADGAVYFEGQEVPAAYSCADPDGTVASCAGTVPNGQNIDTSSPGTKDFSATATDDAGASATTTVSYKVVKVNGVCKGMAVGLPLNISAAVANGPETPCATRTEGVLNLATVIGNPGLLGALNSTVKASALLSHTVSAPGSAQADSTVASTGIKVPSLGLDLAVTAVRTEATSRLSSCSQPAALTSSSRVGALKLNGIPIVVGEQPLTVPLVVGALHVNQYAVSGNTVTRRAVFLDLPGGLLDVTVAESKAGATCGS